MLQLFYPACGGQGPLGPSESSGSETSESASTAGDGTQTKDETSTAADTSTEATEDEGTDSESESASESGSGEDAEASTSDADDGSSTDGDDGTEDQGDTGQTDCGNGIIDNNEECDDGNVIEGDGCNTDCRISGRRVWDVAVDEPLMGIISIALMPGGDTFAVGNTRSDRPGYQEAATVYRFDEHGERRWRVVHPTRTIDTLDTDLYPVGEDAVQLFWHEAVRLPGWGPTTVARIEGDGRIAWESPPSPESSGAAFTSAGFDDGGNFGLLGTAYWDDPSTDGRRLWLQRSASDGSEGTRTFLEIDDEAYLIDSAMDPTGVVVALFRRNLGEDSSEFLRAFDPSGDQQWQLELEATGVPDVFYWVGMTAGPGGPWIFGHGNPTPGEPPPEFWVQSVTEDGAVDQVVQLDVGTCKFSRMHVVSGGDFITIGERHQTDPSDSSSACAARYDADGQLLWQLDLNEPGRKGFGIDVAAGRAGTDVRVLYIRYGDAGAQWYLARLTG